MLRFDLSPSFELVHAQEVIRVYERPQARELAQALTGSEDAAELERVTDALVAGQLVLVAPRHAPRLDPVVPGLVPTLSELLPDEPLAESPAALTSFELRLVDEMGEPIDGVRLALTVDGEARQLTTDGDGRVRVEDATTSFASAKVVDISELRDALRPRWEQIRDGDWIEESEHHSYLECQDSMPIISLASETPHTVVVQPRVVCSRLVGAFFDTDKAFLLPSAVQHVRAVRGLYEQRPSADVLIVGHTDASGDPSYNDPLSLERAEAMLAYLRDDVDAWLGWYDSSNNSKKRWGSREDNLMLTAVLTESAEPLTDTPLRHFQATRGLSVDGDAGPQTREQLIKEYMGFDGTTLPEGIEPIVHGCGENFPPDEALGEEHARRVELFFFDGELGPLPPPPGDNSPPGSVEYPEWRRRAAETHEFAAGEHRLASVRVCDEQRQPIAGAPVRYVSTGLTATADEDGFIQLDEGIAGETCEIEWTRPGEEAAEPWPFSRRIFLHYPDGEEGARRKLHNLGYPNSGELFDNVQSFQTDYDLDPSGELTDIEPVLHDWHDGGEHPDQDTKPSLQEDDQPKPKTATTAPAPELTTLLVTVSEKGASLDEGSVSVDVVVAASDEKLAHSKVTSTKQGKLVFQYLNVEPGTHDITARHNGADGKLISIETKAAFQIKEGRLHRAVRLRLGKPAATAEFLEKGDEFGYDDFTDGHLLPWKAVEVGKTDTVRVRIKPLGTFSQVTFETDNEHCRVSPKRANAKNTTLTVEGVSEGETTVRAVRDGQTVGQFKVWSKPKRKLKLGVRLVHSLKKKSKDISDAKIRAALAKTFRQAVFEFEVVRLQTLTMDFDLDKDGKIDVGVTGFTKEQEKVIAVAKDDDKADFNIFIVSRPSISIVGGAMVHNQRYGFIFSDVGTKPEDSIAHELGHGAFGFLHTNGDEAPLDDENIMRPVAHADAVRLRKNQWDTIHAKAQGK